MGYNNKLAEYHMNDVKLECVSEDKDLEVIISEDLKCEKQRCEGEAVKKANRMLGMIKRNFIDKSKETIIPLLANVNSRSRSLYAIARPSVCLSSVCRL